MTVLIIDNYDSFTFNLSQLTQTLTDEPVIVVRNDAIDFAGIKQLRPSKIILSPGPGTPKNPRDFGICADIIVNQSALSCPILGVCLGHQGIVHYLGGKIGRAPQIVHGKSSSITITANSPLFKDLPASFKGMRYHSLIALEDGLPNNLIVTAKELLSGSIMAIQHTKDPIYGLQFHPESIGTPLGTKIMRNFLSIC